MTFDSEEIDASTDVEPAKDKKRVKARSVSFAPTVDTFEIPNRDELLFEQQASLNYLDALVDSYKLETSIHLSYPCYQPTKYEPRTSRIRSNPQWREQRIRRLMNKLEDLTVWDREEEMKFSQAKFLRDQKLEQIHDRQRNQNLCLNLMRQRHETAFARKSVIPPTVVPLFRETYVRLASLPSTPQLQRRSRRDVRLPFDDGKLFI